MIEIRHTEKSNAALRSAYDELYRQGSTEHLRSYYRWILKQLAPCPGSRLLDVACGTGALVDEARRQGLQASGVDFSAVALRSYPAPLAAADAAALPFADASFDYVVNLGSLEHLVDMEQGVREMARVLHPAGSCCVLVPNTFGLFWTIRHALCTGDIADDGQPLQRYATRRQWERVLEGNGLRVERVIGYELPPPETLRQWLRYARTFRNRFLPALLGPHIPVNLASMLVFLCRKAET